jgi:phospholipase/carboxylesterase
MDAIDLLETIEEETGPDPRWAVLWLHGLGADGHDFVPLVPELARPQWPAVRFVFPHAPVRAVTINAGMRMRAWYDIRDFDLANRADAEGVAVSTAQVGALLDREQARGIPPERTFLAGFSQGGAIALAAMLTRKTPSAGVVALSTYLPMSHDLAGEKATAEARQQPIFLAHGEADPVIPIQAGVATNKTLGDLGFDVTWRSYAMPHAVCPEEVRDLRDWFDRRLAG